MADEAPKHPAPRQKKSQQFDSLGEKDEAKTRLGNEPYALTLGQVSRPEQKASVKAPAFSLTEPAAASNASSETSKLRISSSLWMYLSVIGLLPLVRQRRRQSPGRSRYLVSPPAKKSIKS